MRYSLFGLFTALVLLGACSSPSSPPHKYSLEKPKHRQIEVYHETIGHILSSKEAKPLYGMFTQLAQNEPEQPSKITSLFRFTKAIQEQCQITMYLPMHLHSSLQQLHGKRLLKSTIHSPHDKQLIANLDAHELEPDPSGHLFHMSADVPSGQINTPFVFVRLFLGASQQLTIPTLAVQKDKMGSYVYIHQRSGPLTKRYIVTGQEENDYTVVLAGINRKDLVAVEKS